MLRGSLTDVAITDLVQIPLGNRRSGELLIATEELDARLYYIDGRLVHLISGDLKGPGVLDLIIDWTDGEFEFRPDVATEDSSFDGDLAERMNSLATTIKVFRIDPKTEAKGANEIRKLLYEFLDANDFAIHACLMYGNGTMDVCGAERLSTPPWLESLRSSVLRIVTEYPRKKLHRMLFEDEEGTLVVTCYPEDQSALLVAAKSGATLGAVSITVDRLARRIGRVKPE